MTMTATVIVIKIRSRENLMTTQLGYLLRPILYWRCLLEDS